MNKETFLCRLRAVVREVTCMSETKFNETFKHDSIKFCRMEFNELAKTIIEIKMKKIKLEKNQAQMDTHDDHI